MKLLLFVLLSISVFAEDILTSYRINGIATIEKEMDLALTKKKYWDTIVQKKDTTFGYIESYKNLLACDKSSSTLHFYSLDKNQTFRLRKKYDAFTGKLKGDKHKEGDLRTPIGIYKITQKLSKETKLDPFYGPLAFVTSYPNLYDSYRGKNGSGIWIHGLPEQDRDEYTRGCIAINNSSIECLEKNIDIDKTVLIIDDTQIKQNVSKEIFSSILADLYRWRYSWKYDKLKEYLSFYAPEFVRSDGMDLKSFTKYKTRVFKKIEKKSIRFNDINILPYPNTSDIYQINFKEFYKSDTYKFTGEKTLVIQLDQNNRFRILTEK